VHTSSIANVFPRTPGHGTNDKSLFVEIQEYNIAGIPQITQDKMEGRVETKMERHNSFCAVPGKASSNEVAEDAEDTGKCNLGPVTIIVVNLGQRVLAVRQFA
jgi:hypothetical protein